MTAFLLIFAGMTTFVDGQVNLGYQTPDSAIARLIDQPPTPGVSISPDKQYLLLLERPSMPSIEEISQPELRVGGFRINPQTNGPSRAGYLTGFELMRLDGQTPYEVTGLPKDGRLGAPRWSPNSQYMAFTVTTAKGISLWVAEVATGKARPIAAEVVNAAFGTTFSWLSDSKTLLVQEIVQERGATPEPSLIPTGPVVQESKGKAAIVRTYQDLLQNAYDESVFDYYATSVVVKYSLDGNRKVITPAGILAQMDASPDGNYLFLDWIQRPYSYLVPAYRFARRLEITDMEGNKVRDFAVLPLAESIPKGFDAVRKGPRNVEWRSDKPAELYWVEALDGGDPAAEATSRDRIYRLNAPFAGDPQPLFESPYRFAGFNWGDDHLAIAYERWWSTRKIITKRFDPADPTKVSVISDRSSEDRYGDPGSFMSLTNSLGQRVLVQDKKKKYLYLIGAGASDEGERPFMDQYQLSDGTTKRLIRSAAPYYDYPAGIIDADKGLIILRRESPKEAPNYFIHTLGTDKYQPITFFKNPYPELTDAKNELITYSRKDGVQLSAKVYYPVGYDPKKDGPRPVLMWAYPEEYKSAAAASQVNGSPYEFIRVNWASPLFWLTRGYVIVEDFAMPIIGEGGDEPNDHFVEQLTDNAAAVIDKLVDMGVADRDRIAVGGHSYGAFMTANLLAHTQLFAAGIARSGAYNRTLTPFGFQSEERTFWDAPEVYATMSPFFHADQIKTPLLMIHGQADNNPGTFTLQSERLYQAIKGLGGNARLVLLPSESHGYQARESILHMLWEMDRFLEKTIGSESGGSR